MRTGFGLLVAAAFVALAIGAPEAQSATSFYEGKSIRIIVGGSAGGGYDTYSRVIAGIWASTFPETRRRS